MARFKPAGKTIVTQLTTTAVSPHAKKTCFKQSVSAKIAPDQALFELRHGTNDQTPIVISDKIANIFAISTPSPVYLTFSQEPVLSTVVDHKLFVTVQALPNTHIDVRIEDIEHSELDYLDIGFERAGSFVPYSAPAVSPGVFEYRIYLEANTVAGETLVVSYLTAPDAFGKRDKIERAVRVVDTFEDSTGLLTVPPQIESGSILPIRIDDPGQDTASVSVYNENTKQYSLLLLVERTPGSGIFEGELEIREGSSAGAPTYLYATDTDVLTVTYVDTANAASQTEIVRGTVTVGKEAEKDLHSVSFEVNGVFMLNGAFDGHTITVRGLTDEYVACDILYS